MKSRLLSIGTSGEGFYSITHLVREQLEQMLPDPEVSGVLYLFCGHTSCALALSEDYDPSASKDLKSFMSSLAPRDLSFIQHTIEGPDDSPSHMKSVLLHQHVALLVEEGNLMVGRWQGVFLAEFRDRPHEREIYLKLLLG